MSLTLTNAGAVPLTGLALTITGDFSIATPCGSTTLAAGASCTVQVNFTPTVAGQRTGTLTIASSDASSPAAVPLTGTAVPLGSFTLTVDGGSTSSAAVASGNPASYQLALTPTGGFTGPVALTCTPLSSVQYASCSLLPPNLTLAATAQSSVATINTITEVAANSPQSGRDIFFCLLAPSFVFLWRRKIHRAQRLTLWTILFSAVLLSLGGCGGGSPVNTHLRYTPSGSYQFQITASSTTGPAVSQTVQVTLVVH